MTKKNSTSEMGIMRFPLHVDATDFTERINNILYRLHV